MPDDDKIPKKIHETIHIEKDIVSGVPSQGQEKSEHGPISSRAKSSGRYGGGSAGAKSICAGGQGAAQGGGQVPQMNLLFTEADILARRHELEQAREEAHRKQIEELESKVRELQEKKREIEGLARDDLHGLTLERQDLEERLKECAEQQDRCIQDIKDSQTKEVERYQQEFSELRDQLMEARNDLLQKQGMIAELETRQKKDGDRRAKDEEKLRKQIEEEEGDLQRMTQDHADMKDRFKRDSDAKVQQFREEQDNLNRKIEAARKEIEKKTQEFKQKETQLTRKRDELQAQLDAERDERAQRLGPLTTEKEQLTEKVREVQQRVQQAKEAEEAKTEELVKEYEDQYRQNQEDFDRERESQMKLLFDKECEIREKELELDKLRADNEDKIRDLENDLSKKLKEMENEVRDQEERNRKQLGQVVNKERYRELEDQIHQKTCELQNLEANQQAEEALLKVWLGAVGDKEKHLREEANNKQTKYAGKINNLENELNQAKSRAEQEQRQYDQLKEEIDRKLQEKRDQFEAHTREAAGHLNDLTTQISELKRSLKGREEAAKDRGENIEKRIAEETLRLQALKGDMEEQLIPLREKHAELTQKLAEEQEKHHRQLKALHREQQEQNSEQEKELGKLYNTLEEVRAQFKQERQQLQQSLKDVLDQNDQLREKNEKEIFELNMRLVQTLQATSQENVNGDTTKDLLTKVKSLQEELKQKEAQYEDTVTRHSDERRTLSQKNEEEIRGLKDEIKRLSQDYMKDGAKNPAERVEKLREMLERKTQELDRAKGGPLSSAINQAQLIDEVEEAKNKNARLSEKLLQQKKELSGLMNRRQSEINALTEKIDRQNEEMSKNERPYRSPSTVPGTLRERLDKLSALRGLINSELHEREKLVSEISRLKEEEGERSDAEKGPSQGGSPGRHPFPGQASPGQSSPGQPYGGTLPAGGHPEASPHLDSTGSPRARTGVPAVNPPLGGGSRLRPEESNVMESVHIETKIEIKNQKEGDSGRGESHGIVEGRHQPDSNLDMKATGKDEDVAGSKQFLPASGEKEGGVGGIAAGQHLPDSDHGKGGHGGGHFGSGSSFSGPSSPPQASQSPLMQSSSQKPITSSRRLQDQQLEISAAGSGEDEKQPAASRPMSDVASGSDKAAMAEKEVQPPGLGSGMASPNSSVKEEEASGEPDAAPNSTFSDRPEEQQGQTQVVQHGGAGPPAVKSPIDHILEMIQRKEEELRDIDSPEQDTQELEKLKEKLEAMRDRVPVDHERKTTGAKMKARSASKAALTAEQHKSTVLCGGKDLRIVGRSYDKIMTFEQISQGGSTGKGETHERKGKSERHKEGTATTSTSSESDRDATGQYE